ncbi:hypothetical protein CEXT_519101 [Caerostris extrusa]|uniref:Secreted protein n=1 Tax=Caerostris extrusa TaxID=172846 RepID=A0AAV4RIK2_CAEEX|nr:hypothetical protein CEXT_519101 [Caerostris extrusa]
MLLRPVTCSAPKCPSCTRKWFLRSLLLLLSFSTFALQGKISLLCRSAEICANKRHNGPFVLTYRILEFSWRQEGWIFIYWSKRQSIGEKKE